MWQKLAAALEREDWCRDERFANPLGRLQHRAELTGEIEGALGRADVAHWVSLLNDEGVPAGPVLDMAQVFADPQVQAREMLVELAHPEVGTFRTTGLPVKLSYNPGGIERRPPLLGEHTEEVLGECGLSVPEIETLQAQKIV